MNNSTSSETIENYQFLDFQKNVDHAEDVTVYEYQDINNVEIVHEKERIGLIERNFAKSSGFKIEEVVKDARGLKSQEFNEYQEQIRVEVEKRVDQIKEEAFKNGFEKGVIDGRDEVLQRTIEKADDNLTSLSAMISDVVQAQEKIVKQKQTEIYSLLKTLTKWIILRELKDDGRYIERLIEKLIIELGTKNSVLIQVNQKNFDEMPEVLELIQKKIGELHNVRVEIDYDVDAKGIVIESDNGIVDGTLNTQFEALDKLFSEVGQNND